MNNCINKFINYKLRYLTTVGELIINREDEFIKEVLNSYFRTYIDNYYYGIFNTIDADNYTLENLKLELTGCMQDMLMDYEEKELDTTYEEYTTNAKAIKDLNKICYEIIRMDSIKLNDKDEIQEKIMEFYDKTDIFQKHLGNRLVKLISLVRKHYTNVKKILKYEDEFFSVKEKELNNKNIIYLELNYNISNFKKYRNSLVNRIFTREEFHLDKIKVLIEKMSVIILRNLLFGNNHKKYIIELDESFIYRNTINEEVYELLDNPLLKRYVILGINSNDKIKNKANMDYDYMFACMQDFSHITDLYKKIDSIYELGFYNYLFVTNYKYKDKKYFQGIEKDGMEILMFDEED